MALEGHLLMQVVLTLTGGIQLNDALDRATAHCAEVVCTRKHDAVYFRAVVALRFVNSAFKRARVAPVFLPRKQSLLEFQLLAKERLHLTFRTLLLAQSCAPFLNLARVVFKSLLVPGRRDRRAWCD